MNCDGGWSPINSMLRSTWQTPNHRGHFCDCRAPLSWLADYVDLDVKSRNALDRISQEIRQAAGLQSYSTSQLIFTNDDLTTLTYTYDSAGKKLTRSQGGATQVLLTQCDSLNWYMYQRNMTNGTDEPIPTSDKNQCKLIKLTWVCSRTILGKRANTESVQSAEIVIRKK